jgi:hypothetical protein
MRMDLDLSPSAKHTEPGETLAPEEDKVTGKMEKAE